MNILEQLDPDLVATVDGIPPILSNITRENLAEARAILEQMGQEFMASLSDKSAPIDEHVYNIVGDDDDIRLYVFHPTALSDCRPAMLWVHGGGYITGDANDPAARRIAAICDCTVVSVDYRLAPEHPFPAGPEDCHRALVWLYDNARKLGADPSRIAIGGMSAGAGMAAGVALMNRDRQGPEIFYQYLLYPMLDNLHDTTSGCIEGHPLWPRQTSLNAWEMYLNGTPGRDASAYAAAARADDLSGLPPAYISVGAQDLFRDECIAYAQRLTLAGVPTELHVVPGVYHGIEMGMPAVAVCQRMMATRDLALSDAMAD